MHEDDDLADLEWHEFAEGDEPTVLTTISGFCEEGMHAECPGWSEDDGGEISFAFAPAIKCRTGHDWSVQACAARKAHIESI
jgi:hypothetical protein